MIHLRSFAPIQYIGTLAVLAVVALGGCHKNAETAATAPAGSSAEYPLQEPATASQAAPSAEAIRVSVSLSPALARQAAPEDVVFVFARAAQGPRMPLAIVRKQVKDLPATVVLDDSHGMNPDMKLSGVPELVVVARVSRSGMASAKAGDLEGVSGPVKAGQAISLSIANVLTGP